ncbi:DUF2157 domain-containing protein [Microbulbifer spongiae]|uniref:DUF2157 domain-containing protein n=1 Tax=Microbulbifer spongiae TaxID=2944933 RepID=A0ABY9EE49_9GAMM|nr:DUF2157 domain-containing protein [Microbulbifer sp. MI-G]WKD51308.1 DUF2157 domain-containing protein [Microbulbifer sp. MI-G]
MRLIRLLKHDLAREAREWVADGVISEAQARLICARYAVDYHGAPQRALGYNLLVGLGYLFVGLAVITLLGANWEEIPRALRMIGVIAITIGTQVLALRVYLTRDPRAGEGLFLLGNIFFGAAIILIAQIYHLGEHMPDGVFWWALGCVPFALITRSPWLAIQANALALIWFLLQVNLGFYPVLFPLFLLVSLYVLIWGRTSIILLLMTILSGGLWLEYSLAELWRSQAQRFDLNLLPENLAVAVGLLIFLYVFAHWLARRLSPTARDYAAVISVWCLRFALIAMLIFSFEQPWKQLIEADWHHRYAMWVVVAVIGGATLMLAVPARRLLASAIQLLTLVAVLFLVSHSDSAALAVYLQVATNFALIGSGIWLILRGIYAGISHYFFLGVVSILLVALLRYFDLMGDYVGAALIFILFAGLLIGVAKYWRYRQGREGSR